VSWKLATEFRLNLAEVLGASVPDALTRVAPLSTRRSSAAAFHDTHDRDALELACDTIALSAAAARVVAARAGR
jgi:hypothetical protein